MGTALRRDLLDGPILGTLARLALPIVLANLLQTAYQLTDTYWVGRLGGEAVAAVSISFPVLFLIIALGGGLGVAGSVLVSQYTGAGEPQRVNRVAGQTLLLVVIVSTLLSVGGYLAAPSLMRLMGAGPDILADASRYLQVSFIGTLFMFGFFVYQSIMRGIGEVRVPVFIVLATVLLNLVLDPLFIFGWGPVPRLGVAGAAWATVGTQAVATLIGWSHLLGGRYGVHVTSADLRPDWMTVRLIWRLGLPASLEQSTRALGLVALTFLVATFGTQTLAAYGIGTRILAFVIIPALGLSMATAALVGQNIGAGQRERAEAIARLAAAVAFVVLEAVGVLCFFYAVPIIRLFIPNDPAVVAGGAVFLRLMALTFGFIGLQQALGGAFRGSGNTLHTMVIALVSLWALRFPLAYFLAMHTRLGALGLWWAFPVSNVATAIMAIVWFRWGTWRRTVLVKGPRAQLKETVSEEIIGQEGTGES